MNIVFQRYVSKGRLSFRPSNMRISSLPSTASKSLLGTSDMSMIILRNGRCKAAQACRE